MRFRIGELARRTGVSEPLLRAWERRYGLLSPQRTAGGFRVYGPDDESRVLAMRARRGEGMSASLAAAAVLAASPAAAPDAGAALAAIREALGGALERFDERAAHDALDRLFGAFSLETALSDGVLWYLGRLGERWETGEVSIAQEHFATTIVRGRLLALARNWGGDRGPLALLACPPGEQHDLGLICFGLVLRERGWRIALLGPNTPIDTIDEAAGHLRPDIVVIAAMQAESLEDARGELARLAGGHRVALAGPGAGEALGRSVGARVLVGDPIRAAADVDSVVAVEGTDRRG